VTVKFENVSYWYPGARAAAILEMSAEILPGQVTLLTGSLGSGGSTTLLVAAGLAPHALGGRREGVVATLGVDPGSNSGRRALRGRVGVLLPTPHTQLSGMAFSVHREVAFAPANLGWDRMRIADTVDRAMHITGVSHLADRDPTTLSGGELQRVVMAGVVAMEPEVFLLDEPAMELDPEGARALYALLPTLAESATVLLATTDVDGALPVASRVIVLDSGRQAVSGLPADVFASEMAAATGATTSIGHMVREAGCAEPYPITVDAARTQFLS
jgi:energy-coupling factor transporter ATP-binding protein EcfA2